jgi:hypothetical protein
MGGAPRACTACTPLAMSDHWHEVQETAVLGMQSRLAWHALYSGCCTLVNVQSVRYLNYELHGTVPSPAEYSDRRQVWTRSKYGYHTPIVTVGAG